MVAARPDCKPARARAWREVLEGFLHRHAAAIMSATVADAASRWSAQAMVAGRAVGWMRWSGLAAAALWLGSVLGFGLLHAGYSHLLHPVALLGAKGVAHAQAFNLLGFILPGALAGVMAILLRLQLPQPESWGVKVGAQLLFLSALGFIAMGLFALDPMQLEGGSTQLHSTGWMLWWLTFLVGSWLLALGLMHHPAWPRLLWTGAALSLVMVFLAVISTATLGPGLAQHLAFACWFGWLAVSSLWMPIAAPRRGR